MWVIRLILVVLLVVALGIVLAENLDETVDLEFFGNPLYDTLLVYVVAACFVLGFLVSLVFMGLREWRHQREIRQWKKHARDLNRELTDLRALPLQELADGSATKGD